MLRLYAILLIVYYKSVESILHHYPKLTPGHYKGGDDPGDPLFLTPYVENGDIATGRKLASVPSELWLGVESYAGFFTVDKDLGSNHFFWYFPSMTNATNAPVILWLNGGPGASSLLGTFLENGPVSVFDGKIVKREVNWAINHHLIYVDQPVGTGFSFTNSSKGYCTNEEQVGGQLYSTMSQFFQLFPELQKNEFYIVGESYAGKYGPALAYFIHNKNPDTQVKINLKGVALGNGYCDPINLLSYDKYLYQLGLIDHKQKNQLYKLRKDTEKFIEHKDWETATIYIFNLLNHVQLYTRLHENGIYNFLNVKKDDDNSKREDFGIILQEAAVRKSLHVGKLPYGDNSDEVYHHLILDFSQSIAPWISELLDYYDFVIYNGELDITVGYPLTAKFLSRLKFSDRDKYLNASRFIWKEEKDVAGWVKQGGRLTEIMIRNAGHMVPHDQPKWAWNMITMFTHKTGFMADNDRERLDNTY